MLSKQAIRLEHLHLMIMALLGVEKGGLIYTRRLAAGVRSHTHTQAHQIPRAHLRLRCPCWSPLGGGHHTTCLYNIVLNTKELYNKYHPSPTFLYYL